MLLSALLMLAYNHPPFVPQPPSLEPVWEEWQASAVHPNIVTLNVMPVDGQTALELLTEDAIATMQRDYAYLSRDAARLIERYAPIVEGGGGWWVSGLDPLNGWSRMNWGQLKPNTPRAKLDEAGQPVPGKWIKYESPARVPTRAIFLELSDLLAQQCYQRLSQQWDYSIPHPWQQAQGFWQTVVSHNLPVVVCEGAKKAGCLLSLGYPAVALPGIWNGSRTVKDADGKLLWEHLIPELEVLAAPGRVVLFAFDQDAKPTTQQDVRAAMVATARLFERSQCCCYQLNWELDWGKGIDDVATTMSAELIHEIIDDWITI